MPASPTRFIDNPILSLDTQIVVGASANAVPTIVKNATASAISGGVSNEASGFVSSISGGANNRSSGPSAWVSGGNSNKSPSNRLGLAEVTKTLPKVSSPPSSAEEN